MDDDEFEFRLRNSLHLNIAKDELIDGLVQLNAALINLLLAKSVVTLDEIGFVLSALETSFSRTREGSLNSAIASEALRSFDRGGQGDQAASLRELLELCADRGRPLPRG
jgi:hypothetical protein